MFAKLSKIPIKMLWNSEEILCQLQDVIDDVILKMWLYQYKLSTKIIQTDYVCQNYLIL